MPFTILPIITKEQLKNLKLISHKDDIYVCERIDSFVHSLYRRILDIAENTSDTYYLHRIQSEYDLFYIKYLDTILESLHLRLPDCIIQKKVLIYDMNGKLKDSHIVSNSEENKNIYISVDWS